MIGMIAAIVCALVQEGMDRFGKKYVDDTLDVWAVHGVGELHMPCSSSTAYTRGVLLPALLESGGQFNYGK
jgi:hypothetical protein